MTVFRCVYHELSLGSLKEALRTYGSQVRAAAILEGTLSRKDYVDWLDLKAGSHFDRDRARFGKQLERSRANYKEDIHEAVLRSKGRDFYTCEPLDWSLVGRYDNEEAQRRGSEYKREFASSRLWITKIRVIRTRPFGSALGEPTIGRAI